MDDLTGREPGLSNGTPTDGSSPMIGGPRGEGLRILARLHREPLIQFWLDIEHDFQAWKDGKDGDLEMWLDSLRAQLNECQPMLIVRQSAMDKRFGVFILLDRPIIAESEHQRDLLVSCQCSGHVLYLYANEPLPFPPQSKNYVLLYRWGIKVCEVTDFDIRVWRNHWEYLR